MIFGTPRHDFSSSKHKHSQVYLSFFSSCTGTFWVLGTNHTKKDPGNCILGKILTPLDVFKLADPPAKKQILLGKNSLWYGVTVFSQYQLPWSGLFGSSILAAFFPIITWKIADLTETKFGGCRLPEKPWNKIRFKHVSKKGMPGVLWAALACRYCHLGWLESGCTPLETGAPLRCPNIVHKGHIACKTLFLRFAASSFKSSDIAKKIG